MQYWISEETRGLDKGMWFVMVADPSLPHGCRAVARLDSKQAARDWAQHNSHKIR